MTYRDTSGKTLDDYPRPSVAVDTAVLTVTAESRLAVLLTHPTDDPRWRLPGTFLHPGERLADAVRRSLHDKCDVDGVSPTELQIFDDPERDERGWVLSVAHVATVRAGALRLDPARTRLAAVDKLPDDVGPLLYDHDAIVAAAVDELRRRYDDEPDPAGLLDEPFTVLDLRRLHEAVAGRTLPRDSFRRAMVAGLRATGETQTGVVGKPPELYCRRAD